ncbi:MAG: Ig-like domain-containing protein [Euryarchaeota archaeon]|nr:Ig-like domain-containing protein [Euryarchaeota archaeon]
MSLCALPGCTNVPLTVVGWTGNTLTVRPTNPLAGSTQHQATVSTAARDSSDPGNVLAAPFVWTFRTANEAPSLTVTNPTAGVRWTGGSVHNIAWTASDAEDAANALRVWVNYSATGSAPFSPISGLQGVPGDSSPFAWTVPLDDTTSARLEFTVVDTGGAKTVVLSGTFAIDSTPPTVSQVVPTNGQTDVPLNANIDITFSEPMNKVATGTASVVGLQDVSTSAWVPVTYAWDAPGFVLTVNPVPLLLPTTEYRVVINGTARDASDPGNTMDTAVTSTFTTGTAADTTPPTIANVAATPATQASGGVVTISATITDDAAVSSVRVNVTSPDSTTTNETMAAGPNDVYSHAAAYTGVGMYTFVIWVIDGAGNVASASGSFEVTQAPQDTRPPTISHTPPTGPFATGATIVIEATVTDDDQVQVVKLVYTDVAGTDRNVTMTLQAGKYTFTIPGQSAAGTIRYRIYAEDASGNTRLTQEFTLVVQAPEQPPPETSPFLLVGLLLLVVIVIVVVAVLLRRRKKGGQPS